MIPRAETYAECIRLDMRVTSCTQKGHFNALNLHQENGIFETDFLGETSYMRLMWWLGGRERENGMWRLCHKWIKKKIIREKRGQYLYVFFN